MRHPNRLIEVNGSSRLILTSITSKEIEAGFAFYRFGSNVEPTVELMVRLMAHALLQITAGMRTGGTLTMIMRDLGLLGARSGKLTKRGREFLFDCFDRCDPSYPVAP